MLRRVDAKPGAPTLEELIDELARVMSDSEEATTAVRRAGFPRASVPSFTIARVFWTRVVEDAANGKLVDGVRALVDEASRLYPGNSVFGRFRGGTPASCGSRDDENGAVAEPSLPRQTPANGGAPVSGAESVLRARDPMQALHELLLLLFEASELRTWLRFGAEGETVVRMLPGESTSKADLVFKATELLSRRGLVDGELFERLRAHLPRQAVLIDHVRDLWASR